MGCKMSALRAGSGAAADGRASLVQNLRSGEDAKGWLWKKGAKRHNWKRRWFVLQGGLLKYYTGDGPSAVLKGCIAMRGARVARARGCAAPPRAACSTRSGSGRRAARGAVPTACASACASDTRATRPRATLCARPNPAIDNRAATCPCPQRSGQRSSPPPPVYARLRSVQRRTSERRSTPLSGHRNCHRAYWG